MSGQQTAKINKGSTELATLCAEHSRMSSAISLDVMNGLKCTCGTAGFDSASTSCARHADKTKTSAKFANAFLRSVAHNAAQWAATMIHKRIKKRKSLACLKVQNYSLGVLGILQNCFDCNHLSYKVKRKSLLLDEVDCCLHNISALKRKGK
jgi:hypothetical protein